LLLTPQRFVRRFMAANELTRIGGDVPPIGLLVLAAALDRRHGVKLLDGNVRSLHPAELRRQIEDADLVGINCTSAAIALNAELTLRFVKAVSPGVPVVMGGHHPTGQYAGWLARGADFIIPNEGEKTFPELVEALDAGRAPASVPGLIFYKDGAAVRTAARPMLACLDESPVPRWDLVDLKDYNLFYGPRAATGTVEESRGCNGRCSFCMASKMWSYTHRHKSIERVLSELEALKRLGAKKVQFAGDGFGSPPDYYLELFKEMVKRGLVFDWSAFMRTDAVLERPELAEWAARSGCRMVAVGYESPDPALIDAWRKSEKVPTPIEKYDQVYRTLDKAGIFVAGFYISGHPGEDPARVPVNLALHSRWCDLTLINELRVIKGTPDYLAYKKEGRISKSTFYHDPRIVFLEEGRAAADAARRIFNGWMLKRYPFRMFAPKAATRAFFRHMYKVLALEALRSTPESVKDFLTMSLSKAPSAEVQRAVIDKYLTGEFVERQVRRSGLAAPRGPAAGLRPVKDQAEDQDL
jgi:radical SAM superfamily enzyme YgiQ (UPF0313 family)